MTCTKSACGVKLTIIEPNAGPISEFSPTAARMTVVRLSSPFRRVQQILFVAVADEGAVGERRREDRVVSRSVPLTYLGPAGARKRQIGRAHV